MRWDEDIDPPIVIFSVWLLINTQKNQNKGLHMDGQLTGTIVSEKLIWIQQYLSC